jgi:uncharacterized membrane protein YraQ (UPF0718 family)
VKTVNDVVDVLSCCVLSWGVLTTMLPAFLLAGAIAAFVPPSLVLRNLGSEGRRARAYAFAAVSGMVLSLCTCNVVPLFVSIYRRGAGLGPAFAFLYAGPAINVVSLIFVYKVIGQQLGLWRALGVPIIAIAIGLLMSLLFRREEKEREEALSEVHAEEVPPGHVRRFVLLAVFLLGMAISGGWDVSSAARLDTAAEAPLWAHLVKWGAFGLSALLVALFAWRRFERSELREWAGETWGLVKLVIPILIPSILIIAFVASRIPIHAYEVLNEGSTLADWDDALFTGTSFTETEAFQTLRSTSLGGVFGSLMYFPILMEIVTTKTLLKEISLGTGAALALLLTGPGLSLPGGIMVARAIGTRKVAVYMLLVMVMAIVAGLLFFQIVGRYECVCKEGAF